MNIVKSVIIKGELSGSEDLAIEGQVEGKIELQQNVLTIGANAPISATTAIGIYTEPLRGKAFGTELSVTGFSDCVAGLAFARRKICAIAR